MGLGPRMTVQTLALLSAMLADPCADWYGLELSRLSAVKSGTLYPILARLEHAGWLDSRWETIDPAAEGRPRRRLYRFSRAGVDAAHLAIDQHLARLNRPNPEARAVLRPRGQTA